MEIMMFVQIFMEDEIRCIRIDDRTRVNQFLEKVQKEWVLPETRFNHFLYHKENQRVLDQQDTFYENSVLSGDQLILF